MPNGPPPLADRRRLYGLPHLTGSQRAQWEQGMELLFRSLLIIAELHAKGAWTVLENPEDLGDSPSIYLLDELRRLQDSIGGRKVDVDQGAWGAPSVKPTTLLATLRHTSCVAASMFHQKPRARLRGRSWDRGAFRSKQAAEYPTGFVRRLADVAVWEAYQRHLRGPPYLRPLPVPLPSQAWLRPPRTTTRDHSSKVDLNHPEVVYIGPGEPSLGLPPSVLRNPFSGRLTRFPARLRPVPGASSRRRVLALLAWFTRGQNTRLRLRT